jgi:hypothetical protein
MMGVEYDDVTCTHRHIRLPSVLMCTRCIVIFDSHPYWCVHVTSSCSTSICLDVYMLHCYVPLPPFFNTDGSRIWRCNVYTSIRMGVEHDDVMCTHQYGWESNKTLYRVYINTGGSETWRCNVYTSRTVACIYVYMLHRHVRLPSVLMCTLYIVMFDSHHYWCVHISILFSRRIEGIENVYISIQVAVEHDDVTSTH